MAHMIVPQMNITATQVKMRSEISWDTVKRDFPSSCGIEASLPAAVTLSMRGSWSWTAGIQIQLSRRRPNQSAVTTLRQEKDRMHIQSGTELGYTLGTLICLLRQNQNLRPHNLLRRWTSGRCRARGTISRVAAVSIAENYLSLALKIEIVALVSSRVDTFLPFRCPHTGCNDTMAKLTAEYRDKSNSIGGTVTCLIINGPIGLGARCFDKLEGEIAHARLSIQETIGIEVCLGFKGPGTPGSVHNDPARLGTTTNSSGGIRGGIINGENIYFKLVSQSLATIGIDKLTSKYDRTPGVVGAKGRHQPCAVPRAVPIASRSLLSPMTQPIAFKSPAVVDGSEERVDPTNDPERGTKLVSNPKGGQVACSEGGVYGDE
ncbi:chorismate synthase [Tuber brumale]|nr:chorismate synthase [Tuber brumale]